MLCTRLVESSASSALGHLLGQPCGGRVPAAYLDIIGAVAPLQWSEVMKRWQVSGSVDPMNIRARTRTPVEVRWHNMAKFDHDFIGQEALAAEIAKPKRTTVTLRWNPDESATNQKHSCDRCALSLPHRGTQ